MSEGSEPKPGSEGIQPAKPDGLPTHSFPKVGKAPRPPVAETNVITGPPKEAPPAGPPKAPKPAPRLSVPPPNPQTIARLDRLLALLLLVLAFFLASFAITNSDVWMHLATGRLLAQGEFTFGVDPFSYTTAGVYWINHAWLFDWGLYGLYTLLGGTGLAVLKGLLVVGLGLFLLAIRRPGAGLFVPVICVCLSLLVLSPRLYLQPVLLSFLFLGITLYLLTRDSNGSSRHLWLLPPLFAVWVNVDVWFLLGPLTVALYLLGVAVQKLAGDKPAVPPGKLGIVFVVGILACLLNPYGVRAFVLPPELGYLLVRITGDLGEATAGGRALQLMVQNNMEGTATLPTLSWVYWRSPVGNNLASYALFPLFLLGFGSFILAAIAGRLSWPRLIVWSIFALLSLFLSRLLPFFAVVAGPIAALNLQELHLARFAGEAVFFARSWRVTRGGVGLVFLVLLFLAWPGWLHGYFNEANSPYRVAWKMEPDLSLQAAAEQLQELHNAGKVGRVFTYSVELENYRAWFAPQVKGFVDNRFALFTNVIPDYAQMRSGLRAYGDRTQAVDPELVRAWEPFFKKYDIGILAITNPGEGFNQNLVTRLWLTPQERAPLHGDGRALLFGWKAAHPPGYFAGLVVDRNRQAFGPVPANRQVPGWFSELPTEPPGFWDNYLHAHSHSPVDAYESAQALAYFRLKARLWQAPFEASYYVALGLGQTMAGAEAAPFAAYLRARAPERIFPLQLRNGRSVLRAQSFGPPAEVVLAVRHARRAVAADPADENSYFLIADSTRALYTDQEEFWSAYGSPPPPALPSPLGQPSLRQNLRQIQYASAMKNYLTLRPRDPSAHWALAEFYLQIHFYDAARGHMAKAVEYLDHNPPDQGHPQAVGRFQQIKRIWTDTLKNLDRDLEQRRNDYDLKGAGLTSLRRYVLAVREPYSITNAAGKKQTDQYGYGLAEKGLEALEEAFNNLGTMNDRDKVDTVFLRVQLHLFLGRLHDAQEVLQNEEVKRLVNLPGVGETFHQFNFLLAGARGDYSLADASLEELEKLTPLEKNLPFLRSLLIQGLAAGPDIPYLLAPATTQQILVDNGGPAYLLLRKRGEYRLLRGLLALEKGDTAQAGQLFGDVERIVGSEIYFPERLIAVRYLELLVKYQGKVP